MAGRKLTAIRKRKQQQKKTTLTSSYVELSSSDVVFGRGSGVSQHPGNQRFRFYIRQYKPIYMQASRTAKMTIASQVVEELKRADPPARFVEPVDDEGNFLEVGLRRCVEKTSQALRERKWNLDKASIDPYALVDVPSTKNKVRTTTPDLPKSSDPKPIFRLKLSLKKDSQKCRAATSSMDIPKMLPVKGKSKPATANATPSKVDIATTPAKKGPETPPEGVSAVKKSLPVKFPKSKKAKALQAKTKARKGKATATKTKIVQPVNPTVTVAIPKVTPPSTPTNEEHVNNFFADFGSWIPVNRRLAMNDESPQDHLEIPTPLLSRSSSVVPETAFGDFLYPDEKEEGILPLPKEESFVPLEMVDFLRGMSTGYDSIIRDDQSVEHLPDEELFPFDFADVMNNQDELDSNLMATPFCVTNGFV